MNTKCPHCRVTVLFPMQEEWLQQGADGFFSVAHGACPSCNRLSIYLQRHKGQHDREMGKLPIEETLIHPRSIHRELSPDQVPQEFAEDYTEAARILADSPKASAAISRRILQRLLRKRAGASQESLADAIQHVIKERSLPTHISDSLHTLSKIGDFAAHPRKSTHAAEIIDVEPGEAEWCLDIIDALYDHYFVGPDKARQAKETLNAKREEAGLQPVP